MHKMINRQIQDFVSQNLKVFPAVVILGPRQCGKSSLVKMMAGIIESPDNLMLSDYLQSDNFIYLDLQSYEDLSKLQNAQYFFEQNKYKTVCIDEIQRMPELFSLLRSSIDSFRRKGRFILLGSASRDLVQNTSESLAGRVGFVNLTPFLITELSDTYEFDFNRYWLRGGFPDSYLSSSDSDAFLWVENYLRTYVERDLVELGFNIPSLQLRRLLTMLAHVQGQVLNLSKIADSMQVSHTTIRRYVDLFEQTFILRTLMPFHTNLKKRLIKSPKVFVRDSGLLHGLLGVRDFNSLMGHPVYGSSWEGVVIENIINSFPDYEYSFYRSATGDEIDLICTTNKGVYVIECKSSSAPVLTPGFWRAIEFVNPIHSFIVAPVAADFSLKPNVTVCSLQSVVGFLENAAQL